MRTKLGLLLAVIALVAATALALTLGAPAGVRAIVAAPLVFLVPGLALSAALGRPRALSPLERATVAVGLSLALAAEGALLLNVAPGGIRASSWLLLLAAISLIATVVALLRTRHEAAPALPRLRQLRPPALQSSFFGLAALIVVLAGVVAWRGAVDQSTPGFTEFWLQRDATSGAVRVGLLNHEGKTVTYRVEFDSNGTALGALGPVTVTASAQWQMSSPVMPLPQQPLEAFLYRLDQPDRVYREATLQPPSS